MQLVDLVVDAYNPELGLRDHRNKFEKNYRRHYIASFNRAEAIENVSLIQLVTEVSR